MAQRGRKSEAALSVVPAALRPNPVATEFEPPAPPDHLGEPERLIWAGVFRDYDLPTAAAIAVLATALEAHQRSRECRETI